MTRGSTMAMSPASKKEKGEDFGRVPQGHRLPPQGSNPATGSRKSAQDEQEAWASSAI